jgi:tetratricopeptide (TPR) repeat protein
LVILERALAIDPHAAEIRLNYAQALRSQGDRTRAAEMFAVVARDTTRTATLRALGYSGLADIAMDDQTWTQAVEYLRQGFALDSNERSASQLGYALVRAARPGEALGLIRRSLTAYPGSAALHKNAGYALFQLDSLKAARAEADRALSLDPAFAPALGLRARIRARQRDPRGALADWQTFIASRPSSVDSAEVANSLRTAGVLK